MDEMATIERAAPAASQVPRSSIGSILLHIQNDVSLDHRLEFALSIARATGAHLECLQVTPIEAYVTTGTLGGLLALGKAMEKVDAEDALIQSKIEGQLRTEDVSWDYQHVTSYPTLEIVRRSALSDLVVLGRDTHVSRAQRPQLTVLGDIIAASRTPLLIPGSNGAFDVFGPALIAWNGSFEAANATRAAIGLLKMASAVRILRYTEEKDTVFPDIRLTEYLSRHDIHAELLVQPVRHDYAADLVQHAVGFGASSIVMGGYGHSRAGEFLFGGVTRDLLGDCPVSLVMAH